MEKSLPAIPPKRYFTIGEVSELCAVKSYVLRYWEQEFSQLRPMKRRGNRRYYQHHEVLLIRRIRELLYDQGFTISGARNRLADGVPPPEVDLSPSGGLGAVPGLAPVGSVGDAESVSAEDESLGEGPAAPRSAEEQSQAAIVRRKASAPGPAVSVVRGAGSSGGVAAAVACAVQVGGHHNRAAVRVSPALTAELRAELLSIRDLLAT